jgi:hypothetical protein
MVHDLKRARDAQTQARVAGPVVHQESNATIRLQNFGHVKLPDLAARSDRRSDVLLLNTNTQRSLIVVSATQQSNRGDPPKLYGSRETLGKLTRQEA